MIATFSPAEQRDKALATANHIRITRAKLKRQVADGRRLQPILLDPPPELDTATLLEVLMWQHRWGEVRARKLCTKAGVQPLRMFQVATERQRTVLALYLTEALKRTRKERH